MSESPPAAIAPPPLRERALNVDYFEMAVYWILGALLLGQVGLMLWLDLRS